MSFAINSNDEDDDVAKKNSREIFLDAHEKYFLSNFLPKSKLLLIFEF